MFERDVVGFDQGSWSLKIAELSAGLRGVEFVRFAELPLPRNASSEELEATIQLWAQQRGLAPEVLISALSTDCLTQRHLRLPFVGAKRVAGAIAFEVEDELPLPLDELVLAHEATQTKPDLTEVLVLAATKADLESHLASMHRMELEPRIVEAQGSSLANVAGFLGLDDVARIVLDVGHTKTNLVLLLDGHPVAMRRIPVAGLALTESLMKDLKLPYEAAEEHKHSEGVFERGSAKPATTGARDLLEHLAREVRRSIQAIIGDPLDPASPAEIALCGGSSKLPGLAEFLAERTGIATRLLASTRAGAGGAKLAQAGVDVYAQAASLALRFASTERVTDADFRRGGAFAYTPDLTGMRPQLRLTVGLFMVFLALWVGATALRSALEGRRAAQLEAQIASIYSQTFPGEPASAPVLAAFEKRAAETRELATHLGVTGKGLSVLEILRQISALTPESIQVSLDELTMERQSVVARGHALDFVTADQLKTELSKFEGFQRVLVTDVKVDPRRGGTSFTLSIRLGEDPQ